MCGVVQVSGVISAVVVMIVILALGPLFYSLPKALLAMIIIVALFPLFKQFRELKVYWKVIYCIILMRNLLFLFHFGKNVTLSEQFSL